MIINIGKKRAIMTLAANREMPGQVTSFSYFGHIIIDYSASEQN